MGLAKLKFGELSDELQQLLDCDETKGKLRLDPTQLLVAVAQPL